MFVKKKHNNKGTKGMLSILSDKLPLLHGKTMMFYGYIMAEKELYTN